MRVLIAFAVLPVFLMVPCAHSQSGIPTELITKAESGDTAAQTEIGDRYDYGRGVAQNSVEAVHWWRMAAEKGNASAQNHLGVAYSNGKGVPKDNGLALLWVRKAAEQGEPHAENNLGVFYNDGIGTQEDHAEAVAWFQKAAGQGLPEAQNRLGVAYFEGKGVARDYTLAVQWFRKAADQKFPRAEFNIATAYHLGRGVAQDESQATAWFRKAAEQGDVQAQAELGSRLSRGVGVPQNYSEALTWLTKAADKGEVRAESELADMYYLGHGVKKDLAQAAAWYQKAADQGDAHSKAVLPLVREQVSESPTPGPTALAANPAATNKAKEPPVPVSGSAPSLASAAPGSSAAAVLSPQAIAKLASASTVLIFSYSSKAPAPANPFGVAGGQRLPSQQVGIMQGTGFAVGSGLIVTNSHVFPDGNVGYVRRLGSQDSLSIDQVIRRDVAEDLLLLRVSGLNLPPLALAPDSPVVGDTVYVLGNPLGIEGTFSEGVVSGLRPTMTFPRIQFTAPISHGSSGAPVLNSAGQVVGVATAAMFAGENMNFAVSARALDALLKLGSASPGNLPPKVERPGEKFSFTTPAGFKSIGAPSPDLSRVSLIPLGETAENWTEMVVSARLRDKTTSAGDLLSKFRQESAAKCPGSGGGKIVEGSLNGYGTATTMINCPREPATKQPQVTFVRAIRGTQAMYVFYVTFRRSFDNSLSARAESYVSKAFLCDASIPGHPCPAP